MNGENSAYSVSLDFHVRAGPEPRVGIMNVNVKLDPLGHRYTTGHM